MEDSYHYLICNKCGNKVKEYKNPLPTVDIIAYNTKNDFVLIERKNPPYGLALPGGFVDYGENTEQAALRELYEETNLKAQLVGILGVYSDPKRDTRSHNISVTYLAKVEDFSALKAKDDAKAAKIYNINELPPEIAFDHNLMLNDFKNYLERKKTIIIL